MNSLTEAAGGSASDYGLGAEYVPQAWHALTALASEQQHAFRSIFDVAPVETPGSVQHQHESARDHTSAAPAPEEARCATRAESAAEGSQHTAVPAEGAVQAEVEDVQQRVISTDPEKEVVLRFDFLSGRDSRVRQAIFAYNLTVTTSTKRNLCSCQATKI